MYISVVGIAIAVKSFFFWDIMPCSLWKSTNISKEQTAFIFRLEE
jgi:hypothetical protein